MARTNLTLDTILTELKVPTARRFLTYHLEEYDNSGEGGTDAALRAIYGKIHGERNYHTLGLYKQITALTTDEILSTLSGSDSKMVVDNLSIALHAFSELNGRECNIIHNHLSFKAYKDYNLDLPDSAKELPGFALYCKDLSTLIQVRENSPTRLRVQKIIKNVARLSSEEVQDLADFIYRGGGESIATNNAHLAELFQRDASHGEVLAFINLGPKASQLVRYITDEQKHLLSFDPDFNLLHEALLKNPKITESMLDFSSFSHLDCEEYKAYLKVVPFLEGSTAKALRKIKLPFTKTISSRKQSRKGIIALRTAAVGDEVFTYYANFLDTFRQDRKQITTSPFIEVQLPQLFQARPVGYFHLKDFKRKRNPPKKSLSPYSLENLKRTRNKLVIQADLGQETLKVLLYAYYYDWVTLFADDTIPIEWFTTAETLQSEAAAKRYVDTLHYLRFQGQSNIKIQYLRTTLSQISLEHSEIPHLICTFSDKAKDSALESLLLHSPSLTTDVAAKVGALVSRKVNPLDLLAHFWEATAAFYHLFKQACDEETLRREYQQWARAGLTAASSEQFLNHFNTKSPQVKALYAKYHSPATYEQQAGVTQIVMKSICGKDIPVAKRKTPNLLQEIPFGGGKTVSLPSEISIFPTTRENAHFYSLLGALYAGMHQYGTYTLDATTLTKTLAKTKSSRKPITSIHEYLATFSHYSLAESLFINAEEYRVLAQVLKESPGLQRDLTAYAEIRTKNRAHFTFRHPAEALITDTFTAVINSPHAQVPAALEELVGLFHALSRAPTINNTLNMLPTLYSSLEKTYYHQTKKPIEPQSSQTSIDRRLEEELFAAMLRGQNDVLVYDAVHEGPFYHYVEYDPSSIDQRTTRVLEQAVPVRQNDFIQKIIERQRDKIVRIQEHLEQLVPRDPYIVRRQTHGNLDRRAYLKYRRDVEQGKVPNPRIFYRKIIEERDVATIIAVDMNRLLNEQHRNVSPRATVQEVLATFVEGSRILGDALGIYGFSGTGADNIVVYVFKDLHEPMTTDVFSRMAFLAGQDYNRNGAAYRHFTKKLSEHPAPKKLFLELCAAYVPFDVGYQGERALVDSAQAIHEMRLRDITPVCISISDAPQAKENARRVFGEGSYILSTPARMRRNLVEIYKQFTR